MIYIWTKPFYPLGMYSTPLHLMVKHWWEADLNFQTLPIPMRSFPMNIEIRIYKFNISWKLLRIGIGKNWSNSNKKSLELGSIQCVFQETWYKLLYLNHSNSCLILNSTIRYVHLACDIETTFHFTSRHNID